MAADAREATNHIDGLTEYVRSQLCSDADLLGDAFPISVAPIRDAFGEICGAYFCVFGPRAVELTAVWDRRRNRVLFYNATGERYRQERLDERAIDATSLLGTWQSETA